MTRTVVGSIFLMAAILLQRRYAIAFGAALLIAHPSLSLHSLDYPIVSIQPSVISYQLLAIGAIATLRKQFMGKVPVSKPVPR